MAEVIEGEYAVEGEVLDAPDFTVPIDGVDVGFRDLTAGQVTMINLIMDRARRDAKKVGETEAGLTMLAKIFNIIESTIISEDDKDHVMDAMSRGVIDVPEAYLILRRGKEAEPDDDVEVAKKPRRAAKSRARR